MFCEHISLRAIVIHPTSAKCRKRKSKEQTYLKAIHLHHSLWLRERFGFFRPLHILLAHLATVHLTIHCDTDLSDTISRDFVPALLHNRRLPPQCYSAKTLAPSRIPRQAPRSIRQFSTRARESSSAAFLPVISCHTMASSESVKPIGFFTLPRELRDEIVSLESSNGGHTHVFLADQSPSL